MLRLVREWRAEDGLGVEAGAGERAGRMARYMARYSLAVGFAGAASLLRWALPGPLAGTPFLAFYPAVVAAAAIGGFGPGVTATVLSALAVELLFDATPGRIIASDPVVLGRLALFLAGGVGTGFLGGRERRLRIRDNRRAAEIAEILELTDLGYILIRDLAGRVVKWSTGATRLYGFTAGQAVGADIQDLLNTVFADSRARAEAALVATGSWEGELVQTRADGSRVIVASHWVLRPGRAGRAPMVLELNNDITARKRMEERLRDLNAEIRRARADAERASRAKDRFIAVLSHELRTPLTPLLAAASLLQKDHRFDGTIAEMLDIIRRNAEVEARLIDDLLDITNLAGGKLRIEKRPVLLCNVLDRVVQSCTPEIHGSGLEFRTDPGIGRSLSVEADAGRLHQAFTNLIRNAIKFTPSGGRIELRCHTNGSGAIVEVSDSGTGIEADAIPLIFRPFEQAGTPASGRSGGLGLGLSIAKELIEMHGGTIEAESGGVGMGSTFRVRLPLLKNGHEHP